MADKKTSPKVASKASKIVSSPASTPAQKSVAASDLSQAAAKGKRGPGQVAGSPGCRGRTGRPQQYLPRCGHIPAHLQCLAELDGHRDRLGRPASKRPGVVRHRGLEAESGNGIPRRPQ